MLPDWFLTDVFYSIGHSLIIGESFFNRRKVASIPEIKFHELETVLVLMVNQMVRFANSNFMLLLNPLQI